MSVITSTDTTLGLTNDMAAPAESLSDPSIFAMLAAANQGEIDAGKMAQSKATNADVKAFAKWMVTAHTKMLNAGNDLAKRLNITPNQTAADSIKAANQALANQLQSAAKGTAFDTAYINAQVMGHQAALDLVNRAADQASNPDLKQLLQQAAPEIQQHLDSVKTIQDKLQ
jgi:putative membrane protein